MNSEPAVTGLVVTYQAFPSSSLMPTTLTLRSCDGLRAPFTQRKGLPTLSILPSTAQQLPS
eukprot:CAMPEP_0115137888 /NCGR_PEP_ID=MMETSP0227-20121206/57334_1 /TAXON_ID=89957 /ORGANISM="Polarella glacialis, Strain CCMP 1383" /LENGTH=60 /DNA_ID=CAMNT_0002545393 /DNA_START=243 /DNA_END=425 /DNA_ORIENTATION=-